jgi:hypothetical protein
MPKKLFKFITLLAISLVTVLGLSVQAAEGDCYTLSKTQGIQQCKNNKCSNLQGSEKDTCNSACDRADMPACEKVRAKQADVAQPVPELGDVD